MAKLTREHDADPGEQSAPIADLISLAWTETAATAAKIAEPAGVTAPAESAEADVGPEPDPDTPPEREQLDSAGAALWAAYRRNGGRRNRDQLVLHYFPLVRRVAGKIGATLPPHIDLADLVQSGVFGLIDAIDRYQPELAPKFATYAVQRVRGAIIDELRAQDWVPRVVRGRARALERTRDRLQSRLWRAATERELAAELDLKVAELRSMLHQIHLIGIDALDELIIAGRGTVTVAETLVDDAAPDPVTVFESRDLRRRLSHALGQLAERDRRIVLLYYFEDRTLAEIGRLLGVTESRVCQLHARVVTRLRGRLLETA